VVAGRLKVNGRVVSNPDKWVRPDQDVIHLDGERLRQARKIYLLLNKPKGIITSHGDPQGRKTIYDLLDVRLPWLSPVGRLDQDSSGLILLTNDTDFANLITDPGSRIPKTYLVKLNGLIEDEVISRLEAGVQLARSDFARPQSVRRSADRGKYSWLEIVLTEGKNREVRRMMEAVGFTVLKLVRTRIGPLGLEGLQIGTYRELSKSEVSAFFRMRRPSASVPGRP
jgi:pseudouridine synthase